MADVTSSEEIFADNVLLARLGRAPVPGEAGLARATKFLLTFLIWLNLLTMLDTRAMLSNARERKLNGFRHLGSSKLDSEESK
jgi:hypothetical protein